MAAGEHEHEHEVYGYQEVPFFRELTAQIAAINEQFDLRIEAVDRLYAQEIKSVREALAAEVELRRARREDDREAVSKAEMSINRRLEAMNEFRAQLDKQAQTFVTHNELDGIVERLATLIDRNREDGARALPRETFETTLASWTTWRLTVDERLNKAAGKGEGASTVVAWGFAALGALATATALILSLNG